MRWTSPTMAKRGSRWVRRAYDLIVFDVMLPKLDGLAVCHALRAERRNTPMQRRLELACALVHEPTLIFMDEPTGGWNRFCGRPSGRSSDGCAISYTLRGRLRPAAESSWFIRSHLIAAFGTQSQTCLRPKLLFLPTIAVDTENRRATAPNSLRPNCSHGIWPSCSIILAGPPRSWPDARWAATSRRRLAQCIRPGPWGLA